MAFKNVCITFAFYTIDKNSKMNYTELKFNTEAIEKIKNGVNYLSDAVKVTLGARGKNVIIKNKFGHHITKDGVTVAKSIKLKDAIEDIGAQTVREVASKTADIAGDGTTTATVLSQSIFINGLKSVLSGCNPMDIKRGIELACIESVNEIKNLSKKINIKSKQLNDIANISTNGDSELGDKIAESFRRVGVNGVIKVNESKTTETYIDFVKGMQIDTGYSSPHFITNNTKMTVELENPYILIYDKKISAMKDLLPILEKTAQTGRGLLIIAEDVDGEALATLVVNKLRGALNVSVCKSPSFGNLKNDILHDLASVIGAKVISDSTGNPLEYCTIDDLGSADKVVSTSTSTTFIGGNGNMLNERIKQLKNQIKENPSDILKNRLASIDGGVAVINVGAFTTTELKEKIDRVDDAIHAVRAAIEEGVVVGGGMCLAHISEKINPNKCANEDQKIGFNIVKKSLKSPFIQIVNNCGDNGEVLLNDVMKLDYGYGYNAKIGEIENIISSGVIDPAKVTRVALENACSVSGLLLTTGCVITEIGDE